MRVLVANPGSSSLKLRVVEGDDVVTARDDEVSRPGDVRALVAEFARSEEPVDAAGVRVVHGGTRFTDAAVVDEHVVTALCELVDLAPLHNPAGLAAVEALAEVTDRPVVACFDTAFHAGLPAAAATYAVPWEWTTDLGIRRFGFHGLSHAHASRRAAELVAHERADDLRVVTAHLGAGASLAAVHGGRSVDTTMGYTPLEGLVMATRSGSVDPGVVTRLVRTAGLGADDVEEALERRSGLLGISGRSSDLREVEAAAAEGDERCRLALDVYVHRLRGSVGAMTAALGGLDALVFTGGVGEHSAMIRARTCGGLEHLGVRLDPAANESPGDGDADLTGPDGGVAVLRVIAREELEIARRVRGALDR